jgi:hypothetical protein
VFLTEPSTGAASSSASRNILDAFLHGATNNAKPPSAITRTHLLPPNTGRGSNFQRGDAAGRAIGKKLAVKQSGPAEGAGPEIPSGRRTRPTHGEERKWNIAKLTKKSTTRHAACTSTWREDAHRAAANLAPAISFFLAVSST